MANDVLINLVIGKPLRCRGGHVLGLVVRSANGENKLHVLRAAQFEVVKNGDQVGMLEVSRFNAVLDEGLVRCSICGRWRRFVAERKKNDEQQI